MSLQVGNIFPSIQAAKDAIKTVLAQSESWKALLLRYIFNESIQKNVSHPLPPISIEDLAVDNNIKPPILWKQAGQPRT
jgi:hypothetical protein